MDIWTKQFWKRTVTISVKTMAQAAVGFIGGAAIIQEVDWLYVISGTLIAGLVCTLMAVAAPPAGSQPAQNEDAGL